MSPLVRHAAYYSLSASLRHVERLQAAALEASRCAEWVTTLAVLRLKEAAR